MKYDITIKKINNVHIYINSESYIAQELSEFFQFRPPGYQFTPAFKNKAWDGYIRLFNYSTRKVYLGLLSHVEEFARISDYSVKVDSELLLEESVSESKIRAFAELLNIHAKGSKITPRDYQLYSVWTSINEQRKINLAATASGKSLVIYMLVRWYQMMKRKKVLIIVPTVDLTSQMFEDFDDYSSQNDWSAEDNIHKISAGASKTTDKFVVVSTWQSIYAMSKKSSKVSMDSFCEQFDIVINDEVHLASAKSLTKIIESCTNADVKLGFTGTLGSKSVHHLVLEGLFGKAEKIISANDLMERGEAAQLNIRCVNLEYTLDEKKALKKYTYQEEIDYIIEHKKRNKILCDMIQAHSNKGENVLVLYTKISHGKAIEAELQSRNIDNNIYLLSGSTKADKRAEVRNKIDKEKGSILIGSFGILSTGSSIRNLNVVVFASPYKSEVKVLQSIGRGLRISETKKDVILYDLVDNIKYKKHVNYTLQHFLVRLEMYNKEKFNYKFVNLKL